MLPHLLTNFEQQRSKVNVVFSRNNLLKKKDGSYATNLDEYKSIGAYWIVLFVNVDTLIAFSLNIFQKKFKNSQKMKMLYNKEMIQ